MRPRHGAFGPTLRQLPCVGPSVLDGCFGSLYHGRTRTSSLGTGTRLCTWYGRARSGEVVLCYNIVCYVVRALASALGTAAPMRESGGTGADAFIDASWPLYRAERYQVGTKWVPSGTKWYQVGIVAALHAAMCLGVQAAIEGHAAMVQLLIDAGGCSVCIT